jgi:hypothetical protein
MLQGGQQALMDIVEATIGHDQNNVGWLGVTAEMVHNVLGRGVKPGADAVLSQGRNQCCG